MPAEYVPYGVEWERELMKWRKGDLIGLLRQALTKEEKFTSNNRPMPKRLCLSCSRLQSNGGSCQPNTNSYVTECGGYSGTSA